MSAGGRQLRAYLEDGRSHLLVGAYDVLTARAVEAAGFEVVYVSGYAAAAAVFGLPDVGLTTMSEMVETCSRICAAVERPVLVDADNGYGNVLNVKRAVRAFEATGAAGLHLEDQTFPKRCGHMAGKTLVSTHEMESKLRVALEARRSDDFVVIARTDAIAVEGIGSAIRRALAYREAGADVLFVDAPESIDQIEQIAKEVPGPLLFDWSYDGMTPPVSRSTLEELGYELILFPDTVAAVHSAVTRFLSRLTATESLTDLADQLTPFAALNDFAGLAEWLELERRHA